MNIIHNVGPYIDELKKTLCEGFYFSYGYDLTASRQRRIKFLQERSKDMLKIIACDHNYFWNIHLYKDFQDQHIDVRWYTPLVQGYIGIVRGKLSGREMQISLISRRSHKRAGTRFNARGIDDDGNVANCVETEQMVFLDNIVFSYVMVRGSVPVFWEQKGMVEDVTITRDSDMTRKAFNQHFKDIFDNYSQIFVVDLLSDKKTREIKLSKEYVKQLFDCDYKDKIKYLHFDFHHYCSGDKYQSLKVLIGKLHQGLQDFGFFVEDTQARKIQQFQTGVFRVNCLDSLDRTNVAQSKIGMMVLQKFLQKLGFVIEETFGKEAAKEGLAFQDDGKPIIRMFKHYWAEQGDYLSKQYVGTNSTISKVSRDGKEGIMGKISHKMKNVQRYFINSFSENFAQNSIDIILGKHVQQSIDSSEMRNYINQELKKREDLFTDIKTLKIYCGTWNLGGVKPYEQIDLSSWLFPFKDQFLPDIMIIGFQEIVELNTSSVLLGKSNANNVKIWNDQVLSDMNRLGDERYVFVSGESLVGIYIGLFAKKSISQKLTDLATSKIKLGFSGKMGNKGATAVRFLYQNNSFCFINCHLDSGFSSVDQKKRVSQINDIYANAFIKERGTSGINYSVKNHQNKIIFGDLNFRIFLDNFTTRKLIDIGDYEQLMKHDEMGIAIKESDILRNYKEGKLIFDPTYKYNFNSNQYDSSSKGRVPAWCDRILFEANTNMTQIYYGRSEIKISDHRPVYALFEAKIKKINVEAKLEIEKELIKKYRENQINIHHPQKQEISNIVMPSSGDRINSPPVQKKRSISAVERLQQLDDSLLESIDNISQQINNSTMLPDLMDLEELITMYLNDGQIIQQVQMTKRQTSQIVTPKANLIGEQPLKLSHHQTMKPLKKQVEFDEKEEQLRQLFFKQKQKTQVPSSIIKQVGIFAENDEDSDNEEKKQTPVHQRRPTLKTSTPVLFQESDDDGDDKIQDTEQKEQVKQQKKPLFTDDEEDEEENQQQQPKSTVETVIQEMKEESQQQPMKEIEIIDDNDMPVIENSANQNEIDDNNAYQEGDSTNVIKIREDGEETDQDDLKSSLISSILIPQGNMKLDIFDNAEVNLNMEQEKTSEKVQESSDQKPKKALFGDSDDEQNN